MAAKIRLVLFDAFDTLIVPRLPIHEQYALEAHRVGLTSVDPVEVRKGFRAAFKATTASHPNWGKHTDPPLTPEQWWTALIKQCMTNAGAEKAALEEALPTLGPALVNRFSSDAGYRAFDDAIPTLRALRELGIKTSVISNGDPRIIDTLDSLGISPFLTSAPTISWTVDHSKPSQHIFQIACQGAEEPIGPGVLMIGDELDADYRGATAAGLEARLLRREGGWSDGARRDKDEQLDDVETIRGLEEIVAEVRRRQ